MCCNERDDRDCETCADFVTKWIAYSDKHTLPHAICLVGPPRSGKTSMIHKIQERPLINRFIYHLEMDRFTSINQICNLRPKWNWVSVDTMLAAVVLAGRIPIIDHVNWDELNRRLGAKYRMLQIHTKSSDVVKMLNQAVEELIELKITFKRDVHACPACNI